MPSSASLLAAPPPPPPLPPPWPRAVALDVEFSHYQRPDDDDDNSNLVLRVPADVAVVSDEGKVLLRALIAPPPQVVSAGGGSFRWVGGVPLAETEPSSSKGGLELDVVVREIARLLSDGALLVGHGVKGDVASLGGDVVVDGSSSCSSSSSSPLSVHSSRVRDTSTIPALLLKKNTKKKNRGKKMKWESSASSRGLEALFSDAFGVALRPSSPSSPSSSVSPSPSSSPSSRHDPVADAAAAMALYCAFVRSTLADASCAAELEEMETRRLLLEFQSREKGERKREREKENE